MNLRNFSLSIFTLTIMFFTACTEGKKNKDVSNNINEVKAETVTATKYGLNPEWGISELVGIKDGKLVCKTENGENFYYTLNTTDFGKAESFGVKGNAGNEWVMPHLLLSDEKGKCYVIDNGTRKITVLENYKITSQKDSPVKGLVNNEKMYKNLLCYEDMSPDKIILRIKEFNTNVDCDSVVFEDPTHQGMAGDDDFAYDARDSKLVLAKLNKDCIQIYGISDEGKLEAMCNINGKTIKDTHYFTSVAIGDGKIYILSQRHRKGSEGSAYIEVYDFDGKATRNINLGFKASQMVYNAADKSLILLESKGESLQVVKL